MHSCFDTKLINQLRIIVTVLFLSGASILSAEVVSLPSYNVDINKTSVSGQSSGGFMAVQFHIAWSSIIKGAGVIAGGPYYCAQDSQITATNVCTCTGFGICRSGEAVEMVPELVRVTEENASAGAIDPVSNLSNDKVWMLSGSADSVVPTQVMKALDSYYKNYISASRIYFKKDIAAEHAMLTETFGNSCGFKGEPFINDCDFDAAGELLKWIYGDLNPKNTEDLRGELIEFDQGEFIADPDSHGMWQNGWVYVPASCQEGARCRIHVAFHGCSQYPGASYAAGPQGKMGDTYVKHAGYNEWADTNRIIVLYPQANALIIGAEPLKINPFGCWDWWGYDDTDYARKSGHQMAAVKAMVDRLAGVSAVPSAGYCDSASNLEHIEAGRAYTWFFWLYFARGSNDFLGYSGLTQTLLKETSPDVYKKVVSCP